MASMSSMSDELLQLLQTNNVHQDIISWLQHPDIECFTVRQFANFIDKQEEAQEEIMNNVESQKRNKTQRANVKMAWREAEGLVGRQLKRSANGLTDENLDEPLNPPLQRSIERQRHLQKHPRLQSANNQLRMPMHLP